MKKSKLLYLTSSCILAGVLASCGGGGGSSSDTTTTTTETPTTTPTVVSEKPKISELSSFAQAGTKTITDGNTSFTADLSTITNAKVIGSTSGTPSVYFNLGKSGGWGNGVHSGQVSTSDNGKVVAQHNVVVGKSNNSFSLVGQNISLKNGKSGTPFLLSSGITPTNLPTIGEVKFVGVTKIINHESEITGSTNANSNGKAVTFEATGNATLTANFDRDTASIQVGQLVGVRNEVTIKDGVPGAPAKTADVKNINQTYNLGTISGNKISGTQTWQVLSLIHDGKAVDMKVTSSGGIYGQDGSEASVAVQSDLNNTTNNSDGTKTKYENTLLGVFEGAK